MVWYDNLLSLPPQALEEALRRAFSQAFQEYPELIEIHKHWLSDENAEKHRAKCIEKKLPVEPFEIWLRVIREEMKKARPDLA